MRAWYFLTALVLLTTAVATTADSGEAWVLLKVTPTLDTFVGPMLTTETAGTAVSVVWRDGVLISTGTYHVTSEGLNVRIGATDAVAAGVDPYPPSGGGGGPVLTPGYEYRIVLIFAGDVTARSVNVVLGDPDDVVELDRGDGVWSYYATDFGPASATIRTVSPRADAAVLGRVEMETKVSPFVVFGDIQLPGVGMTVTDASAEYSCPCVFAGPRDDRPLVPGPTTFGLNGGHIAPFPGPLLIVAEVPDPLA